MTQNFKPTWDLEAVFAGGSESNEFRAFLDSLQAEISNFQSILQAQAANQLTKEQLIALIHPMQQIMNGLKEADSFTACIAAENQSDRQAVRLSGQVKSLYAEFLSAMTLFDQIVKQIPFAQWTSLLDTQELQAVAFPLTERKESAEEKLSSEQESIINDLTVDGYHGWGDLYNTTVSKIRIPFEEGGKIEELSAGQAHNKLSDRSREVREKVFANWEKAWEDSVDFCADALNHLSGFRLQVYKHRGWNAIHKEPLQINRMSEQTLKVMWDVIEKNKAVFTEYLHRKAKLLGVEQLSWSDVEAPIGEIDKQYSYAEAAELIVEQFRKFSPKMADFAEMAFAKQWIEAEDRPGKRPGGFCTSFPVSKQTRIFMTFSGTPSNLSTLAHELGHGYHQYVMDDMPALAQEYAINVAETASTFAEMIIADAAVKQASTNEEKLILLEDKIQRSVAFFMNIHARFIFETNFYEERRKGIVGAEQLNELMVNAQKQAFDHALGQYHPTFWASKLHFYITEVPFYNFPYTFGYLFSSGIYARALEEGTQFEDRYVDLLRDTGSMTVEQLAQKHLDV
ncbi:MAG: oligoendopeptidase, partial [Paenibacillus sp. RIFOXYA1_FULL_44_5]